MKKFLLFAPALFLFFPMFARASSDHLWINQIQVSGNGGSDDEFIELYNPTDQTISLKGWSIQYKGGSSSFPLSTSNRKNLPDLGVPSHGYFLITNSKAYNGQVAGDMPQATISLSGTTAGATIFLVSSTTPLASGSDALIVDKLGYGASTNNSPETVNAPTPPSEKALVRAGDDTDNNALDFTVTDPNPHNGGANLILPPPPPPPADTTPPAENPSTDDNPPADENPPVAPEPLYSSAIIISEFLPNPDGNDSGEEWIELYNNSSKDVDLSGWTLDDESDSGIIGKDAYVIPDGSTIKALSYFVINLPPEAFALNNTGGDTVRLFWPNETLTTSVAYTANAKEDTAYALKSSGVYDWTSLVTKGGANQFPDSFLTNITSAAETKIKINEIFPNPPGPDSGGEWVEIFNSGTEPIFIHNWTLDDGNISDPIGSSAYKIQSPTISPGGLAVLVIPAGKFALNNTTDTVRLFNENNVLIDSITYQDAKEGLSYALVDNKWDWATPTPNAVNQSEQKSEQASIAVVINELFPEPESGGEEFIELYNPTDQEIDLAGFKLADLATDYKLSSKIAAHGFLVVKKSDSKIALNNSGKEKVSLIDPKGQIVSSVEYEDAPKLQSYNLTQDGTYAWSSVLTPGSTNVIKADLLVAKTSGKVKGATLPRTGNDQVINIWDAFVIWGIIWYIYYKTRKDTNINTNDH